jgi:hypothetical protein
MEQRLMTRQMRRYVATGHTPSEVDYDRSCKHAAREINVVLFNRTVDLYQEQNSDDQRQNVADENTGRESAELEMAKHSGQLR